MMIGSPRLALILSLAVLPACASQGDFPSLAPRAVERELSGEPLPPCAVPAGNEVPPAPPVAAAPADDPELGTRVAALTNSAQEGQRAFEALLPSAERSAARAGAAASESWIEAQQDLSRLEAARARATAALSELDSLLIARAETPTSPADLERLRSTAEFVREIVDGQSAAIDRLQGRLNRP